MFDLDVVADEEARTPYEFRAQGQVWRVPHAADLTLGQQVALDQGRYADVIAVIAEKRDPDGQWQPAGRELAQIFLGYKAARIGKFRAAWLTNAGVEVGEAPASPSSSKSTARR